MNGMLDLNALKSLIEAREIDTVLVCFPTCRDGSWASA